MHVSLSCACGDRIFRVRIDLDEQIGVLTCAHEHHSLLLDSRDHWHDVVQDCKPRERRCRCGERAFEVDLTYDLRDDGDVRSVAVELCCVGCRGRALIAALRASLPSLGIIAACLAAMTGRVNAPSGGGGPVATWASMMDATSRGHARSRSRAPSRAVTAVLAAVLSGCSLIAVSGPLEYPPHTPLRCTNRHAGTVVDVVIGAPTVVVGGWMASIGDHDNGNTPAPPPWMIGVPILVVGQTYLASAIVGFQRVVECQAAMLAPARP